MPAHHRYGDLAAPLKFAHEADLAKHFLILERRFVTEQGVDVRRREQLEIGRPLGPALAALITMTSAGHGSSML